MKKRYSYTIRDSHIRSVIREIDDLSKNSGYDYAIVGGMAVQIYLYKKYGKNYNFRPTGDIDIAVKSRGDGKSLYDYFLERKFAYEEKEIKHVKILRTATKHNVYLNLDIDNATGIPEDYFDEIINDSKRIKINKEEARVISLEDLIVTKLDGYANGGRTKDLYDLICLINAYEGEINFEKIESKIKKYYDGDLKMKNVLKKLRDEEMRKEYKPQLEKILKVDRAFN